MKRAPPAATPPQTRRRTRRRAAGGGDLPELPHHKKSATPPKPAKSTKGAKKRKAAATPSKKGGRTAKTAATAAATTRKKKKKNTATSPESEGTPIAVVVRTPSPPPKKTSENSGHFTKPTEDVRAAHKAAFLRAIDELDKDKKGNKRMLTMEEYNTIRDVLVRHQDGESCSQLRKAGFPSAHHWAAKFSLRRVKTDDMEEPQTILLKKTLDIPLDQCKKICTYEALFDVLYDEHCPDHVKGDGLYKRIREIFENIPRHYCKLFSNTCPICLEKGLQVKKPVSGHQPILTPGFGKRGQFDLIDMQSCPDEGFKYICNYYDHGTKLGWSQALVNQRATTVARALIDIFTILGPPAILQPDNARNMQQIACFPQSKKLELDDVYVSNVIQHIKHLWPEVNLVRVNPRHSAGNGGVERFNGCTLRRVGHWCVQNNSRHWSVGIRITAWR